MSSRKNLNSEHEKIVLLAINAYEQNGEANFSLKELTTTGLGRHSIQEIIKKLETDKILEKQTINGCYYKYKINTILQCPNFIFDERLQLKQKEILVKCMDVLKGCYSKIPGKVLAAKIGENENCKSLYKFTSISDKNVFEWLQNIEFIKLNLSSENYKIIEVKGGYQINSWKKDESIIYKCKTCGETKLELMQSKTLCKSCTDKKHELKYRNNLFIHLFAKTKKSSKRNTRVLDNNLSPEYIETIFNNQNKCDYYTGLPFEKYSQISIDRIDSDKGYIEGNIVLTTAYINIMKNDLSINKFKEIISQIANNLINI